ncbi:hypothetical protein EI94DRAFT_560206 [Lactarius quietus]|nr:hypothetical protein EI94DRAFT_560206 [Lactarius quietus]
MKRAVLGGSSIGTSAYWSCTNVWASAEDSRTPSPHVNHLFYLANPYRRGACGISGQDEIEQELQSPYPALHVTRGQQGRSDYRFFAPTRVSDCPMGFQRISLVSSSQSPKHLNLSDLLSCMVESWNMISPFQETKLIWPLAIGAPRLALKL